MIYPLVALLNYSKKNNVLFRDVEDWTDFDVVGRLMEAGIPQKKIVLAFHHPDMRPLTEFATA